MRELLLNIKSSFTIRGTATKASERRSRQVYY